MWFFLLAQLSIAQPVPDAEGVEPANTPEANAPELDEVRSGSEEGVARLRAVLARVERFAGVQVEQTGSVLRLTGQVPSVAVRGEVVGLASRMSMAAFVDDQLTVQADADASTQQADQDAQIAADLRALFREVEALREVRLEVGSGVVHLDGTVRGVEARAQAVQLAKGRAGVVVVDDRLALTSDLNQQLGPAMQATRDQVMALAARLPIFLVAVAVVVGFWLLSWGLGRWNRLFERVSRRPLLRNTVQQISRGLLIGGGVLIALEILDATSLVGAVLGTAGVFGLAIGFAFQDIIENYLAGILLSIQQPFSKDDFVGVGDVQGVVVRLTTRNTLLLTLEGNHVYLPNAKVFKASLTNYSRNPHRRFDFDVGIGNGEDLNDVIRVGLETLVTVPGVVSDPAPAILIGRLGDSSVVLQMYGWVDQRLNGYFAVRTEAIRRIKESFDASGYDMPEPIYRVTMTQAAAAPPKPREAVTTSGPVVDVGPEATIARQAAVERDKEKGADLLATEDPSASR